MCITGVLFVLGGDIAKQGSKSVDCLALDGGKWENGPELPVAVFLPSVAQIKGIIYLLDSFETKQLLKLDPEKKAWVRQASPPNYEDQSVSMTTVKDQLCVAGGHEPVCLWYNPAVDAWIKGQQPLMNHIVGITCSLWQ